MKKQTHVYDLNNRRDRHCIVIPIWIGIVNLDQNCSLNVVLLDFRSVAGNMLAVSGGDNKVSIWKEEPVGTWVCISDLNKDQEGSLANAQG